MVEEEKIFVRKKITSSDYLLWNYKKCDLINFKLISVRVSRYKLKVCSAITCILLELAYVSQGKEWKINQLKWQK